MIWRQSAWQVLIKERAPWWAGKIATALYHTGSDEHAVDFVNLFHPCYPSALERQPSTLSLTHSLKLSSSVAFSGLAGSVESLHPLIQHPGGR